MEFYITAIIIGLCLAAMTVGIYITMKIFNIPDITTDGSYTLGAVVTAVLLTHHYNLFVVFIAVIIAGAIAGICTGIVHTKLKIDALLAGIIVMTALYSINLSVLGRSNIPLLNVPLIFSSLHILHNETWNSAVLIIGFVLLIISALTYILKTDFGIAMRATGNNPAMTTSMGVNNDKMKIIGLAIANALTAFSGFLVAQFQNFTDINMGIGIVITGLGSLLIGDALIKWFRIKNILVQLLFVVSGSILFQLVLAFTLAIGVDPNLLKLVTALFVLFIVAIPRFSRKPA